MKYFSQTLSLFESPLSKLPKDNRWVKLGDSLPWGKIERIYNSRLNNRGAGAGNIAARTVIGALIVKHKLCLSDVETIEAIRENPYIQYMLGLEEFTTERVFDPSLFVTIRKRLGVDDINSFTEALMSAGGEDGKGDRPTHSGTLKVDATCCDAEMRYPTDLDLLHDGLRVVERVLDKFCGKMCLERPHTGWEKAHKMYSATIKRRSKSPKGLSRCLQYLIHTLSKNVSVALLTMGKVQIDHNLCLTKRDAREFAAVLAMLKQQKEMFEKRTHKCKDRIVSVFQPHVRPIVRGKAKARVEFGAKIGASIVSGYTFIDHHSWDAYNECDDLMPHLRAYKRRFGCLPRVFEGDKIYMNRRNRRILKLLGVEVGGMPLGRPPKDVVAVRAKMAQYVGERNEIEATFGTTKRIYNANDIRGKLPATGATWAALCFFAKNVWRFLRNLLFALLRIRLFALLGDTFHTEPAKGKLACVC